MARRGNFFGNIIPPVAKIWRNTSSKIDFNLKNKLEASKVFLLIPPMRGGEKTVFIKRLAVLINSGIPIALALGILEKQAASNSSRKVIMCLRDGVERGQSLSRAMGNYKNVFGDLGINIIFVGEISGTLSQNLHYLANEMKKKQDLKRTIVAALIYPAFIVVATIGIVILLAVYVFPKILPIFSSFRTELPWTTRALIAMSSSIKMYWLWALAGSVFIAMMGSVILRNPRTKHLLARFLLKIPLLGSIFRDYFIANFTRTFGLLLKNEMGIVEILKITGKSSGSMAYEQAFEKIAAIVARGDMVSVAMKNDKLLFPLLLSQMVEVGEMTGRLDSSLAYISEIYEDELNNSTRNLAVSIEPMLMILMGILVGFVAISIITPIYGITQNLRQ